MGKQSEKTDYSHLLKTNLPLSKKTYKSLRRALQLRHLKCKDITIELKHAYQDYVIPERMKKLEKLQEEGGYQDWD